MRRSILKDTDGGAILEFAIAAPVFILVLFAAVQIGLVLFVQNALDTAAREASRFGITGQAASGLSREEAIHNKVLDVIRRYSGGVVDPSKIQVAVKAYNSLVDINNPEPFIDANGNGVYDPDETFTDVNGNGVWDADQGVSGSFGLPGQVVQYEISYEWDTVFPIFGRESLITLKGITPVMNEEF